ncbi:hypothetical protein D9M71_486530 [compost metagenome]
MPFAWPAGSVWPRTGSRVVQYMIAASTIPGAPSRMNAQRQPHSPAISPLRVKASTMPRLPPLANRPTALPRSLGGNRSAISDCAGGVEPASPTPTKMRASASCNALVAMPQSMVHSDQMNSEAATTLRRLERSASIATGIARVA